MIFFFLAFQSFYFRVKKKKNGSFMIRSQSQIRSFELEEKDGFRCVMDDGV